MRVDWLLTGGRRSNGNNIERERERVSESVARYIPTRENFIESECTPVFIHFWFRHKVHRKVLQSKFDDTIYHGTV